MTLVVTRVAGLVTVQDLGRPGRMHEGLAPGGALVPEWLVAANRSARNADDAPAIEVLGRLVVRAEVEVLIGIERAFSARPQPSWRSPRNLLHPGEEFLVESSPLRVAYLAIRGGIDAPLVLGGRGTQRSAGLGALLRAGDRVASAGLPQRARLVANRGTIAEPGDEPIRIIAGPDRDDFGPAALDTLVAAPYRILPTSDRVGTRLDGAAIPRIDRPGVSRPMVRGAIEVPPDGKPIVLGPEHPTTGGYPVLAVIAHADLGRFFTIRLGGTVRFANVA